MKVYLWCDGAAKPSNPGPAGIGVVAYDVQDQELFRIAEYLGWQTNNFAEYSAVKAGLKRAIAEGATEVVVHSDSRLVVDQLNGRSDCRQPALRGLLARCWAYAERLEQVSYSWVPREKNRVADGLSKAGAIPPTGFGTTVRGPYTFVDGLVSNGAASMTFGVVGRDLDDDPLLVALFLYEPDAHAFARWSNRAQ